MRIGDLSATPGRFVTRVYATVMTADRRPGRGELFLAADTAVASVFDVTSEIGTS